MPTLHRDDEKPAEVGRVMLTGLKRRRDASRRLAPLPCGCRDPWPCRHYDDQPSQRQLDAYAEAAEHLLNVGMLPAPNVPAMRRMWRRRGCGQRLAVHIAERWELAA
jgi:hypothetical protein